MQLRSIMLTGALALAGPSTMLGACSAVATSGAAHPVLTRQTVQRPAPARFRPVSVTFVSASDGWVLGSAPCARRPCTSVLATTNGGRSWHAITAPSYPVARFWNGRGLARIRFADQRDGFAYGSQLWVTHDAGAAWHQVALPGRIADLETSAGVVYAASTTPGGAVTIYQSKAGTDSWHRTSGLPAAVPGFAGLGTMALHGTAAWVMLGSHLYATQNGSAWAREHFTCPRGYAISSVAAASARRVTLLCTGQPAAGSTPKRLFSSADGGAAWFPAGTPPRGGDGGILAQPSAAHVFVASSSGATWLYDSSDGGRHWHVNLTLDDGGKGWRDFGFTTASQGVAVEGLLGTGSHLYITYDAGRTWHRVTF